MHCKENPESTYDQSGGYDAGVHNHRRGHVHRMVGQAPEYHLRHSSTSKPPSTSERHIGRAGSAIQIDA